MMLSGTTRLYCYDSRLIQKGCFESGDFNVDGISGGEILGEDSEFDESYTHLIKNYSYERYFNCYGVCDTIEQFIDRFIPKLEKDKRIFVVNFVVLEKENESEHSGWRWHKWGPYIGDKTPKCEYLRDENDSITQAVVYNIYEVKE